MGTMAEMLSTPLGVIEWFVYLLAAVMFVIGLHLMNSPKTARKGNMVSAVGMILAVVMAFIVLFAGEISNGFQHGVAVVLLIAGIIIGAVAGVVSAKKVKMTDMPQLVSVFNTVGGGADMPVVISVLNACTGTAVAMSGLAINNIALIVAGALVGAAGVTLSIAMSKAMNRPLLSVLAGGFGGANAAAGAGEGPEGSMKETSADDLAVQLVYAEKVIFVPGFGLAQAQAQRELADLGVLLKNHGVEVSYAIHPVAGRMPGHMNVLLAEANVPYEELVDLDDINPQFPQANVALVVGANDVTNPAARKPGTPVSGMPILDVDKAQNVVVMKRGRGTGYAGIQNELYFEDNTQMLFGDAKASLQAVIAAVKELIN